MQYLYIHNLLGKLSKCTTLVGYTCLVNVLTEVVVVSFVDSTYLFHFVELYLPIRYILTVFKWVLL